MPYSEIAFYDLGLDDQVDEVPETSADSQRVVYEDFRLESQQNCEATSAAKAQLVGTADAVTSEPENPYSLEGMENIVKYSSVGSGATRSLIGEARTFYSFVMEEWNHRNENNPNHATAVEAEAKRQGQTPWF